MLSKSKTVSRLRASLTDREDYIRAKLNHLLPSQIKALRSKNIWTQVRLAEEANMKQARISAIEKPGAVAFTLETLIRLAAVFKVGLQVRFVPFSQMVDWENSYSQDRFNIRNIEEDYRFNGSYAAVEEQAGNSGEKNNSNLFAAPVDLVGGQDFTTCDYTAGAMR